jgi:hypothetical protein
MNANDNLERRIADFYESEAPSRAPDWVLRSTLDTIDDTQQRRVLVRVPWRFPQMNSFAKLAIAVVAVIAVGAIGWRALGPNSPSGVGGQATPSPTIAPSPTPTATPLPTAAPLTESFTSTRHGISLAYPAGWTSKPATEAAPSQISWGFEQPWNDVIYEPTLTDQLFIAIVSQPFGGTSVAKWITQTGPVVECTGAMEPITVDGFEGATCDGLVLVAAGNRGYVIKLYTGDDLGSLRSVYSTAWFESVLATVRLKPADAVDTAPSASA